MRRVPLTLLAAVLSTALWAGEPKERTFRFTKEGLGKLPAGWKADKTGTGEGSLWKILADDTAPSKTGYVLAQIAAGPSPLFNLCVAEDTSCKDVEVSVAFKAMKGKIDQGGGVVWRYQDASNYYVARYNPLEDNLRVYKVMAGKRIQLATKEELKVKAGEWHTLRVEHAGRRNEIECYLDGQKLLSVDRETSIDKPGKVGLWSKADAQTYFDNFKVIDKSK